MEGIPKKEKVEKEGFGTETIAKAKKGLNRLLLIGSLALLISGDKAPSEKEMLEKNKVQSREVLGENKAISKLDYIKPPNPEEKEKIEKCFRDIWTEDDIKAFDNNSSVLEVLYNEDVLESTSWFGQNFYIPPEILNTLLEQNYFEDLQDEEVRNNVQRVSWILKSKGHERPDMGYLPNSLVSIKEEATELYFENIEKIAELPIIFNREYEDTFSKQSLEVFTVEGFDFSDEIISKIKESDVVVYGDFLRYERHPDLMEEQPNILEQTLTQDYITGKDLSVIFNTEYQMLDGTTAQESSEELNAFLGQKEGKDLFVYFKSLGYNIGHINEFILDKKDWYEIPNLETLKNPLFKEMLCELSKISRPSVNFVEDYYSLIKQIKTLYNINDNKDLEDLVGVLKNLSAKGPRSTEHTFELINEKSDIGKLSKDIIGKDADPKYELFLKDPAIDLIKKFNYHKNLPVFLENFDSQEQSEMLVMIARSLLIDSPDAHFDEKDFEKMFEKIIEARTDKIFLETPLFKDRNVMVIANTEIIPMEERGVGQEADSVRFFNQKCEDGVRLQNAKSLEVFRKNETNSVDDFFAKIDDTSNLCLVFSGHGSPESMSLNDTLYIDPEQISSALIKRFENKINDTPIIILGSCHSHELATSIYENIIKYNKDSNKNVSLPIIISEAEYGQYGYSKYESEYNDLMMEFLLNPKLRKVAKMKDVLILEKMVGEKIDANMSIFVPAVYEKTKPQEEQRKAWMQIADNLEDKDEKTFAEFLARNKDSSTISYFEAVNPDNASEIKNMIHDIDNQET